MLASSFGATAQVYRCGNAYQSSTCAGGRQIETAPLAPAGAATHSTVYLCKTYQGSGFWSSKHCNHRVPPATLERMVSVPADMAWEDKVKLASGQRRAADALRHSPANTSAPLQQSTGTHCQYFTDALHQNESAARAGGTAHWMEHLAQERRNIIAQQQAARCR